MPLSARLVARRAVLLSLRACRSIAAGAMLSFTVTNTAKLRILTKSSPGFRNCWFRVVTTSCIGGRLRTNRPSGWIGLITCQSAISLRRSPRGRTRKRARKRSFPTCVQTSVRFWMRRKRINRSSTGSVRTIHIANGRGVRARNSGNWILIR